MDLEVHIATTNPAQRNTIYGHTKNIRFTLKLKWDQTLYQIQKAHVNI